MMSKKQFFIGIFFAALLSAAITVGTVSIISPSQESKPNDFGDLQQENARFSSYVESSEYAVPNGLNFIEAADKVTKGVVHIKAEVSGGQRRGSSPLEEMFREFYGDRGYRQNPSPARSSGSGVIISPDGYIVTNNHVVENASKLLVVLHNNKEYEAEVIGTDPNTDLALIKIEEEKLNFVQFGDSDQTQVGEWVLAVGNPFNLTSTVTAGIVSAKARNINILNRQNRYGIESFIQTDAAVNPGNSGGALVNLNGQLVGINTAIATPTGSYAGYSFAVPASLVKKVVNDIKEYGIVQRAVLGVSILNLNSPALAGQEFSVSNGIYIQGVGENSAAAEAGLEEGDIVIKINDDKVNTVSELQERIARKRPGDQVSVTVLRDGNEISRTVQLKNLENNYELVQAPEENEIGGALFRNLNSDELEALDIEGGAVLEELGDGKWRELGLKEGFIITAIDKEVVSSVEDLSRILQSKTGGVLIEGYYPDGTKAYYGMGWQ